MREPLAESILRPETTLGRVQRWLRDLFAWPNTFYDRPRFRYPYYDRKGRGMTLYGYGGRELYCYSHFSPLEGYFRRRRRRK